MHQPSQDRPLLAKQRQMIGELSRLAVDCARCEADTQRDYTAEILQFRQEHDQQRQQAVTAFQAQHAALILAYQEAREAVFVQYEVSGAALASEEAEYQVQAAEKLKRFLDDLQVSAVQRTVQIESKHRDREKTLVQDEAQFQAQLAAHEHEVSALAKEAVAVVQRRCPWPEEPAAPTNLVPSASRSECLTRHASSMQRAGEWLFAITQERCSRFLEDGWVVLILIFSFLASIYPMWLWLGEGEMGWLWALGGSAIAAIALAVMTRQIMRPLARSRTLRMTPQFQRAMAEARGYLKMSREASHAAIAKARQQYAERREQKLLASRTEAEQARVRRLEEQEAELRKSANGFQEKRVVLEERHEQRFLEIDMRQLPQIERAERQLEEQLCALATDFRLRCDQRRERFREARHELTTRWEAGLKCFTEAAAGMNAYCGERFSNWEQTQAASAATHSVAAIPFGTYAFSLAELPGEPLENSQLNWPREPFLLPAAITYPETPSLLIEAEGEGREAAVRVMQNVMLRLLTAFPPGKVRFTIIDPVGLGENFSAFMHLADFDERLVSNRIWTESSHIQQRLTDLTEHMENVIQKYLRNEFESILDYNEEAGEVAEPFQILVVANFPANCSDEAARRLVSIATSGPRCGVYTLLSVDTRQNLPRGFDLADLKAQAVTLSWEEATSRFVWQDPELKRLPLTLERPPADERFTGLVREIGEQAQGAMRVEVPFASVLPAPAAWWTGCSRDFVEVPLGRAGAKKMQYLRLGKGTSQHVLIAGKTGSGKSTLLNAVITNLAAHYPPSELQFYLIDFKKGVEFKAYAAQQLPHARVIAIESEREFGLSVLERLDEELKQRGDLFRACGAQDVAGYRNANPAADMPRVLLLIDEFQEFFTSDDKISNESALLLDRLVRQGRAFGIHVLLGSQTLAGAYSLARSTIGQMAVRIALQCSESDAHLILSEENTAARLLSRPGEAIYNDANGLFEGNHPFQVVWLSDKERETHLRRVSELARERKLSLPTPTVFEGNVSASPRDNDLLCGLLASPPPAAFELAPRAWLGAAVAIKEPTHAVFRRQGGANLLLVGQQEDLAQGIMHSCLAALAAQSPVTAASATASTNGNAAHVSPWCYVLDSLRSEQPEAALWHRGVPGIAHVTPRDAAAVVKTLAAEVERRLAAGEQTLAPLFLFIHNVARFRDLKKSDDFGLGGFGEEGSVNAAKQLATILREGPALGVHTVLWCDSYSNVNRWLERSTLRDLEMRVLFQMSAADSSNLMDSPAASRLGPRLAFFFSEDQGEMEKFRPYAIPSPEWLSWIAATRRNETQSAAIP